MSLFKPFHPQSQFSSEVMWFLNSSKNLNVANLLLLILFGKCGGLIISTLTEPNTLGFNPGRSHCVIFLGKALHPHNASPPRSINGYQ